MCKIVRKIFNKMFLGVVLKRAKVQGAGAVSVAGKLPNFDNSGRITVGRNVFFRAFRIPVTITVHQDAELTLGHDVFINDGVNICAARRISIGSHAKIGDVTFIFDTDFHPVAPDMPMKTAPVTIGENVWIGANCMILAGASIGDHSVIAAGSIVTGPIPAKSLAAGIPARVIKTLDIPDGWVRP